ncbi:MAG: acyltransferase family protein [Bacteroidales bacterium]|nr:acyltransferase family protein [Bacteroidales bacterium]
MKKQRILYLDNIRILLAFLVIITHLAVIYGGGGGWYYKEVKRPDAATSALLTIIIIANKAFLLGLFFMISGMFTALSAGRVSTGKFVAGRFIRLGIPLAIYALVVHPLTRALQNIYLHGQHFEPLTIFKNNLIYFNGTAVGPLWFVELLLFFTLLFMGWHVFFPRHAPSLPKTYGKGFPATGQIVAFIVVLSLLTFVVRIWFPVGWLFKPFSLELANLLQYMAFFVVGLYLPRTRWFDSLSLKTGKAWMIITLTSVILAFLVLLTVSTFLAVDINLFAGGLSWLSALFVFWELVFSVGMAITLTVYFREKLNHQTKTVRFFSRNVYAAFVVHPLVITALALLLKDIHIYPMLKYFLLAPFAILSSFLFGYLLRLVPGMKKIL